MSFWQIEPGARASGLGGAFVALADDATAVGWNPAGLTQLGSAEVSLTRNLWFQGAVQDSIHAAGTRGRLGWGAGGTTLTVPGDDRLSATGARSGIWSGRSVAGELAAGWSFGNLAAGLQLGFGGEQLASSGWSGFAATLGVHYRSGGLRAGLAAARVGGGIAGGKPPTDVRIGGAYTGAAYAATLEVHKPLDDSLRVNVGGEWRPAPLAVLRAGYRVRIGGAGLSALAGFTAGLGTNLPLGATQISLDYAFWPMGELGTTHRVTLSWRPAPAAASSDHGATPKSRPISAAAAAPALGSVRISDSGGELVISWPASDVDGVVGYTVFASMGSDALRKLASVPVTQTTLRMKKPSGPSGTVLRVRVRALAKDGSELDDSEEATYKLP